MSHQPSQFQILKDNISSAVDTASTTLSPPSTKKDYDENKDKKNFTRDDTGNVVKKGNLKHLLNEAARPDKGENPTRDEEGVVQKVLAYIPSINGKQESKLENREGEEEKGGGEESVKRDEPPRRPDHDVQVEEFLRAQYHSRSGDDMPDPDGN